MNCTYLYNITIVALNIYGLILSHFYRRFQRENTSFYLRQRRQPQHAWETNEGFLISKRPESMFLKERIKVDFLKNHEGRENIRFHR